MIFIIKFTKWHDSVKCGWDYDSFLCTSFDVALYLYQVSQNISNGLRVKAAERHDDGPTGTYRQKTVNNMCSPGRGR